MAQRILNYGFGRTDSAPQTAPQAATPEHWAPRAAGGDGEWQFISLQELIARVRRRLLLIVLFAFVVTALTYKIVTGLTPLYESRTQLVLETQNAAVLGLEQSLGFGSLDERAIQSKLTELRSTNFLEKIASQHGLLEVEEFNPVPAPPPFWKRSLRSFGILPESASTDELTLQRQRKTQMINRLRDKVSVNLVGVSHVIEIGVKSEDPELAASLANSIADTYIVTRLESRYNAAERTAGWFAEKVAGLKADVQAADTAIEGYRAANGLIESNQGDQIGQQIAELTSQIVLAETERASRETELRRIQNLRGNPQQLETAISSTGNPLIQNIRDQILTKRSEVQQFAAELGANHPTMIAARNELADLQSALSAELDRLIEDARDNLAIAQSKESKLKEILNSRQTEAADSNHARVTLATMERDASAKRSLLEGFLSRRTEVTAQEDFLAEKPEARVIASAEPGRKPVFPPKRLALIGAVVGSMVLGCLLAVLAEELDNTYRSADQLEQKFPTLRVVGTVPIFGRSERSHKKVAMAVVKSPDTAYAESIRSLAGRLTARVQADPTDNIFLFTSAEPGEGKTSTIAATARQLALNNQKTILIDCDLRRPTLTKAFSMSPSLGGLIPYLHNEVAIDRIAVADNATPLDLIFAGGQTRDVFPLITSEPMYELMNELRRRYEVILIDSPPVMAVDDVQYLREYATMLMFCVRWGKTRRRIVDRALKNLIEADGSQPIGLVLSRMNAVQHASYDYGDAGVYAGKNAKYYTT
ncbi:MAG: GumC family protein [Geminicoccaceae bacterium]